MDLTRQLPIVRYDRNGKTHTEDTVLQECALSLFVDSAPLTTLSCLHRELEELVLGYLFSQGLIRGEKDIAQLHIDPAQARAQVTLATRQPGSANLTTDSGDYVPFSAAVTDLRPVSPIAWNPQTLMDGAGRLLQGSELFRRTGNIHRVMLCRGAEPLCEAEDLGRYNALDKAVGKALRAGFPLRNMTAYTSGRIPLSLVEKVVRCGIPILVSRSAPTWEAVRLAKTYGLTLLGFARPDRLNHYTGG